MIPIYVAANTGFSGKTFVSVGLALLLRKMGYSVGYLKPIGKAPVKRGKNLYDADAVFLKDVLELPEPLDVISPFVMTFEGQNLLLKGKMPDVRKKIMTAFKALKKRDFVIIGGSGSLFEGALLHINVLELMEDLDARVLLVEPWRGEFSSDSLYGVNALLGKRLAGSVINKVPQNTVGYVRETLAPALEKKGVRIFGVFPKDKFLEAVSVRQLNDLVAGKVLCCEDRLEEFVENFSIGAMDVDNALNYFRRTPNKAVITGAHRSDIQLAAMETSTKCIILTGGLYTNDVVLGKAQMKGIPIISVADDTFTTVDRIEAVMGKTRIADRVKIERAGDLIRTGFDLKRFLKNVK